MKKIVSLFLAIVIILLVGCNMAEVEPSDTSESQAAESQQAIQLDPPTDPPATPEQPSVSTENRQATRSDAETITSTGDVPIVFMTTDISPEGLMAIFEALGHTPTENVAVNVHTGESPNSFHLRPDFIRELVQSVNGTIVETNVAYASRRASTAYHLMLAEEHGFTAIAPVDIMDANGFVEIPVVGGTHLSYVLVGDSFHDYDFFITLSHFTGHTMGGFGAALKNISIGLASREGKSLIHSGGTQRTGLGLTTPADIFQESMAEAAMAIVDYVGFENFIHINVLNNISVDCDCFANPRAPDMHDIGILASLDPVALDQASVDLIFAAEDGASVVARIQSRNGTHIFEHAEALGFGSREYILVSIDD